jgi:hypothetical protein
MRFVCDIRILPGYYFTGFFFSLLVSTIYNLVHRIALPKILIEYDKAGIYIYNRRNKPPITIRYEQLWSATALPGEKDFDEIDSPDYSLSGFPFASSGEMITGYSNCNAMTGSLRLELPDQFIKLHGVKNVRDVRRQLDKLVYDNKKNKMAFYEDRMMKRQREVELEELRKHDPNT